MGDRHAYVTLVASLPHLGQPFTRKDVPISRYRLEQRLAMLAPADHRRLRSVVAITAWAGVARFKRDADVIARARSVIADLADSPDLADLVASRMETRTLIAALRLRRDGADTPGDIGAWGHGRWCGHIRSRWRDPAFGLGHVMPWISEASRLMLEENHIGVERLVLKEVFRQLDRAGARHEFDFEAVAIYALRWVIVERWSRYGAVPAAARLRRLVGEARGMPAADAAETDAMARRKSVREVFPS